MVEKSINSKEIKKSISSFRSGIVKRLLDIAIIASLIYILIDFQVGFFLESIPAFICVSTFLFIKYYLLKKSFFYAKNLLFLVVNLSLFYATSVFPFESGCYVLYFPLIVVILLIWSNKYRVLDWFWFVFTLILGAVNVLLGPIYPVLELTELQTQQFFFISLVIAFTISTITIRDFQLAFLNSAVKLRKEEQKLRGILEHIPSVVFLINKDLKIEEYNKKFALDYANEFGSAPEIQDDILDYILFEEKEKVIKAFNLAYDGKIITLEQKINKEGVEDLWIQVAYNPIRNHLDEVEHVQLSITDISKQKLRERIFEDSDRMMEENPSPKFRVQFDGTLSYSNRATKILLPEFVLEGKVFGEVWLNAIEVAIKENISFLELPISDKYFQFTLVAINGKSYVNFYGMETSFIKEAELKMSSQKDFYETILNNISSEVVVFNQEHKYIFVNPRAVADPKIRAFLIGKDDFDYCKFKGIKTDLAEKRRGKFLKVLNSNQEIEWLDAIEKEGSTNYMLRRMTPFSQIDKVTGEKRNLVIGYGIDITDRKLIEEELERQSGFIRKVIDSDPNQIYVKDKDGRFLLANKAVATAYGFENTDELIGKSLEEVLPNLEDLENLTALDKLVFSNSKTYTSEEKLTNVKGEVIWYSTTKLPILTRGGETNLLGISVDITEQKKAQNELTTAKNVAERASLAKSRFLSNMSHEIRTPLNAIVALTDFLLLEADFKHEEILKTIKFSSNNLLIILNDILDFSKIEAEKVNLVKKAFNVKEIIYEIGNTFSVSAQKKDLTLKLDIGEEIPDQLIGDEVRLTQILFNLCSNAIKFTKSGGITITVSAERKSDNAIKCSFTIIDTGVGIPNDELKNIFKSFTQLESNEPGIRGTGLGLAIVKRLVTLMDGEIEVESALGVGSVFTVKLPFSIPKHQQKATIKEPELPFQPVLGIQRTVLVVEDDKVNQFVAKQILQKRGYEVLIANNGSECLDILKERSDIELVLMDLNMPVLDGMSAAKQIRLLPEPISQVPIIAITADAFEETRNTVLSAGMNDFITKPINLKDLFAAIDQFMDN